MQNENDPKKVGEQLSEKDRERIELLQRIHEKQGKQLRIDLSKGTIKEIDELKEIIGKKFDDPEEKYNIYYKGIRRLLMKYLPRGPKNKEGRQIIYDEKNIFLNRGKKKSDNEGKRLSDGRMSYKDTMNEMFELVVNWVSSSQNPIDLYQSLYDLNEKYGYGHEKYDMSSVKMEREAKRMKQTEITPSAKK